MCAHTNAVRSLIGLMKTESMMLNVKLFAQACQLAGSPNVQIPWRDGDTVSQLRQRLAELHPALRSLNSRLFVAVNNEYARDEDSIRISDEVACFPPVSGG